ncbi:hypothetical protein AK812_SmicGene2947 [Symbiodinium microadriaticum]|uniref:SAM domain-containing protein n=1 Tax=Symbiodinium microadriaticum TaxID=2951 RepID=A0A1Q9F0C5_SYMMI|nr:hypothetical protein AK812_SmicGene2947 [Symbiodinium microadriaticum]
MEFLFRQARNSCQMELHRAPRHKTRGSSGRRSGFGSTGMGFPDCASFDVPDVLSPLLAVKSINEFTDSLAKALAEGDGIPSKAFSDITGQPSYALGFEPLPQATDAYTDGSCPNQYQVCVGNPAVLFHDTYEAYADEYGPRNLKWIGKLLVDLLCELTRELLAEGLRRALEIGGEVCKQRFLETLAANIHKFALQAHLFLCPFLLQEQYSLSRVYPVEISSEYRNLQSFFIESATEGDAEVPSRGLGLPAGAGRARSSVLTKLEVFNGTSGTSDPPALSELRRRFLPAWVLGTLVNSFCATLSGMEWKGTYRAAADQSELVHKFKEEQTTSALKAIDVRARAAFFAEVRLNLFRFSETAQKELVETFTDLKAEVVKLVDSTTQDSPQASVASLADFRAMGGLLIGLSAALAYQGDGKITKIGGSAEPILASSRKVPADEGWSALESPFLVGLLSGGLLNLAFDRDFVYPQTFDIKVARYCLGGVVVALAPKQAAGAPETDLGWNGEAKENVWKVVGGKCCLATVVCAALTQERVAVAWRNQAKQAGLHCTVVAWKTADYGFVKREGRHNDDIQLHVANAKGERFKNYIRRNGVAPGVRVKFDVDFEEEVSEREKAEVAERLVSGMPFYNGAVRRLRSPDPEAVGSDLGAEVSLYQFPGAWASLRLFMRRQATLLAQVKALFQAVQSPPFQATFRHLTGGAKRAKEAFLLQAGLCLKKGSQNNYWDQPELSELAGKLRRSFFYVEGYGELMDDWLQSRVKKLNEDFLQRAVTMLGNSLPAVLTRLRQIFRPGRWIFLCDPRLESDLINLFDEDFHIYNDIVRSPPLQAPLSSGPMDLIESALMEVLRRLPGFPPLLRLPGPGHYRFGRVEVLFQLAGTDLAARVLSSPSAAPTGEVLRAVDFFVQFGPQEFPNAAVEAVQSSDSMHLCPTTGIQDVGAPLTAPGLIRPPMSFAVAPMALPAPGPPAQPLAPMVPGMAVGLAPPAPVPMFRVTLDERDGIRSSDFFQRRSVDGAYPASFLMAKAKGVAIRRDDTRRMEEEAKQMEAKLELLRRTMDVAEQSAKGADAGRWRSGASGKPLTKGYIKSVLEARPPKRSPKSPTESAGNDSTPQGKEEVPLVPASKLVSSSPSGVGGKAAANLQAAMLQQNREALEVEAFLCSLKLDRYVSLFMEHGFDCMEVVKEMQEQHMQQVGMAAGHILKLRKRLSEMAPSRSTPEGRKSSTSGRRVTFGAAEVEAQLPVPGQKIAEEAGDSSNLLVGTFDEEESAASFQEALRAWRGGADPSPAAVQEPSAAPKAVGSFWSSLGDSEVNLERASTPVKPPAETISTETQGSASPNEEKLCCYQCFKQFYARYAVEREVPPEFGGGCKRLCSEACAEAWAEATRAKVEAVRQRQTKLEQIWEMERALEAGETGEAKVTEVGAASAEDAASTTDPLLDTVALCGPEWFPNITEPSLEVLGGRASSDTVVGDVSRKLVRPLRIRSGRK